MIRFKRPVGGFVPAPSPFFKPQFLVPLNMSLLGMGVTYSPICDIAMSQFMIEGLKMTLTYGMIMMIVRWLCWLLQILQQKRLEMDGPEVDNYVGVVEVWCGGMGGGGYGLQGSWV